MFKNKESTEAAFVLEDGDSTEMTRTRTRTNTVGED